MKYRFTYQYLWKKSCHDFFFSNVHRTDTYGQINIYIRKEKNNDLCSEGQIF